jgi:uroporphyrinogen-III decarboxylase
MTNRERLSAIMDGKSPDRIPWIPRLLIWHRAHTMLGTLPDRFEGMSLREVERDIGMGTPARDGRVFVTSQDGDVEISEVREGASVVTTYRTPKGTVSTRFQTSDELESIGLPSLEVEHMIKGPDDIAPVAYMLEHTTYTPTYEAYLDYEAEVGDDGYPLVAAGDCPLHHYLQKFCGYENGFYLLYDHKDKVESLFGLMTELDQDRVWALVTESPARLILHGLHLDSSLTPPPLFEQYITPYYQAFSERLHARDKKLCMHADNDSSKILKHIQSAGFDMAETFTTDPVVNCTIEETREAWGRSVIVWGAVPSVILEDSCAEATFEAYMRRTFKAVAPGDAFILGVADNIMPAARLDRLERISEMVEEWGEYPIDPARIP